MTAVTSPLSSGARIYRAPLFSVLCVLLLTACKSGDTEKFEDALNHAAQQAQQTPPVIVVDSTGVPVDTVPTRSNATPSASSAQPAEQTRPAETAKPANITTSVGYVPGVAMTKPVNTVAQGSKPASTILQTSASQTQSSQTQNHAARPPAVSSQPHVGVQPPTATTVAPPPAPGTSAAPVTTPAPAPESAQKPVIDHPTSVAPTPQVSDSTPMEPVSIEDAAGEPALTPAQSMTQNPFQAQVSSYPTGPSAGTSSSQTANQTSGPSSGPTSGQTTTQQPRRPTLAWNAPVAREDGSRLYVSDIANYIVLYRKAHESDAQQIKITQTSLTLQQFSPGVYEFAVSAVDRRGLRSKPSQWVRVNLI